MKARNFRYIRPASLAHAYQILADADGDAVPIAGGQSLLAGLNMRLSAPKLLVDIGDLKELTRSLARRRRCAPRRADAARRAAALRTGPQTSAAADPGRAAHRPHRDPQPRHARRKPGLCRSGGGAAGLRRGARSDAGAGQHRGRARGESGGFLQGIVRDRPAAGRIDRRGQVSGRCRTGRRSALPSFRAGTATSRMVGLAAVADHAARSDRRARGWSISAASTAPRWRTRSRPRSSGFAPPLADAAAFDAAIQPGPCARRHARAARRHQGSSWPRC